MNNEGQTADIDQRKDRELFQLLLGMNQSGHVLNCDIAR